MITKMDIRFTDFHIIYNGKNNFIKLMIFIQDQDETYIMGDYIGKIKTYEDLADSIDQTKQSELELKNLGQHLKEIDYDEINKYTKIFLKMMHDKELKNILTL